MRLLPSRIFLWVCLLLFITQAVYVDARSRKEKKKIEEETAPDPVTEEENSDPAPSGRDARQHSNQPEEGDDREVSPLEDVDHGDHGEAAERTKKSYCATGRSHDGHYNGGGHPHGPSGHGPSGHGQSSQGPYGRSDAHYQPDMDQYHGGGRGPGYGPSHPNGYSVHGPDTTDYHRGGHGSFEGPEGHINPGYARKSQGEYGYGGQGGKGGGDLYHAAASAPASVYRPSYQAGHESYGGGSDYSQSYGYGGHGPSYSAASGAGVHAYPGNDHYAPHPYGPQAAGYSTKSAFGSGVYPPPAGYGPPGHAYGVAPMYGPMYHGPTGYPSSGYGSHAAYNPYMPYNAPAPSYQYGASYPMPGYPQPYGYGPPPAYPPPPSYQMHGSHPGIPVTLTCSVQQHDGPYGFPAHTRGNPAYYRASDNESHPSKPALTMVMIPASQNKTQKPNEKQPNKDQNDQPINEVHKDGKDNRPAMSNQGKTESMKGGDPHSMMQAMGGGGGEMGGSSGGMGPQAPRESASYQRMPFSLIRQRQMESMTVPKPVFYQSSY